MSNWDGKERRGVERDWIERDRLLTEVHQDMKHLLSWTETHEQSDNSRFELANKRITWVEKVAYLGIGGLATLNIFLKLLN